MRLRPEDPHSHHVAVSPVCVCVCVYVCVCQIEGEEEGKTDSLAYWLIKRPTIEQQMKNSNTWWHERKGEKLEENNWENWISQRLCHNTRTHSSPGCSLQVAVCSKWMQSSWLWTLRPSQQQNSYGRKERQVWKYRFSSFLNFLCRANFSTEFPKLFHDFLDLYPPLLTF